MTIALKKTGDRQLKTPKTGEIVNVSSVPYARASFAPKFKRILTGRGGKALPYGQPPADMIVAPEPLPDLDELPPPLPEELPPPLPVIPEPPPVEEKKYRLPDGSSIPESEARTLPPTALIWHRDFGAAWKKIEEVFI